MKPAFAKEHHKAEKRQAVLDIKAELSTLRKGFRATSRDLEQYKSIQHKMIREMELGLRDVYQQAFNERHREALEQKAQKVREELVKIVKKDKESKRLEKKEERLVKRLKAVNDSYRKQMDELSDVLSSSHQRSVQTTRQKGSLYQSFKEDTIYEVSASPECDSKVDLH